MSGKKKAKINPVLVNNIALGVILLFILILLGINYYNRRVDYLKSLVVYEVTMESGTQFVFTDFFGPEIPYARLLTNVAAIDFDTPGSYNLKIEVGRHITTTETVILNIVDTTAPTGTAIPQTVFDYDIPAPEDVITDIYDLADVTVEYACEMEPLLPGGEHEYPVKLTDAYGNESIINVPFTVIDDHDAPVISGVENFEAFIGEGITYRDGLKVTDNIDPNPSVRINTEAVNLNEPGVYPVTYIATDAYGNSSEVTINLTMRIMPERYYPPEELYEIAREVIDTYDICNESMSDIEITIRIFNWVSRHIIYINTSDRVDWTAGAYDGLTTLRGDCYNFMAVARAMLGAMGIESITIDRYPTVPSTHFWNLVNIDGLWYHCDACVFLNMTDITYICLRTDSELDPWNNSYDVETLPDYVVLGTESIQDRLDLVNLTERIP